MIWKAGNFECAGSIEKEDFKERKDEIYKNKCLGKLGENHCEIVKFMIFRK